ncbi:MAG: DUF1887 family CARF protein [bacterium]|nr:DUF1887 family CARF protein [bacterium]
MTELKYDVVIHLIGEQLVPNYMAIKLSEASTHILMTTTRTKIFYEKLKRIFSSREMEIRHVEVPATDYRGVLAKLDTIDGLQGLHVGFNVTGGTKVMMAAALDWCRTRQHSPFYFDTQERKIHFFGDSAATVDMPPVFESVAEFLTLAGYVIARPGRRAEDVLSVGRRRLLREFWQNRDRVRRPIGKFADATDKKFMNQPGRAPNCFWDAVDELEHVTERSAPMLFGEWRQEFPEGEDWRPAAVFGAGGWFEEWMLMTFSESERAQKFTDLQTGLVLQFGESRGENDAQEIDLAYTDGYVLTLIECKAGRVKQEYIQKLENLRQQLGGVMGRGFLCVVNQQDDDDLIVQRVKAGGISMVTHMALPQLPKHEAELRVRRVYQFESDYR